MDTLLQVTEIYKSIQGESLYSGFPCVFIRLTGCPLRCKWCDTVYAFNDGQGSSIEAILAQVDSLKCSLVELTGGEPLAQSGSIELMSALLSEGKKVLIETSGALDISTVPSAVHIIMDIKCPDSGMLERNLWSNLSHLKASDEIKFVVASKEDFNWAHSIIESKSLLEKCEVSVSPAWGLVKPDQLCQWVLAMSCKVRLNLQLHKYIWSPRAKGV